MGINSVIIFRVANNLGFPHLSARVLRLKAITLCAIRSTPSKRSDKDKIVLLAHKVG